MLNPYISVPALALSALALTACVSNPGTSATAGNTLSLHGQLSYFDRMALPPQAKSAVELRLFDADGDKLLASVRQPLAGRQIPVPFSINATLPEVGNSGVLELRAAIELDGRLIRLSEAIPVFIDEGVHDLGVIPVKPFNAIDFGTAWSCGSTEVMLGFTGVGRVMRVGDEDFAMRQTRSASGVRYEALGDLTTVLHAKGRAAVVSLRGTPLPECALAHEPVEPFRASGNEPPWRVTIADGGLALITEYGAHQQSLDLLQTDQNGTTTRYRAVGPDKTLVMTASRGVCHDSMTGMPHPWVVALATAQGVLRGCGGSPVDLLTAHDWEVSQLDDQLPTSGSHMTLSFSAADGRVAGNASCNRFHAGFALDGESLRFDMAASTMMACPEPSMVQERRFLEILSGVHGFDIDTNGSLTLIGSNGRIGARPTPRDR